LVVIFNIKVPGLIKKYYFLYVIGKKKYGENCCKILLATEDGHFSVEFTLGDTKTNPHSDHVTTSRTIHAISTRTAAMGKGEDLTSISHA
jgi:hypothetical protein